MNLGINLKVIREIKGEKGNFRVYVFGDEDVESVKRMIRQFQ